MGGKVRVIVRFIKNSVLLVLTLSFLLSCTYESKEDIAKLPATDISKLNVSQFEGSRSKPVQQVEAFLEASYGNQVT